MESNMAEKTLAQTIRDAEIDARSLSEFISKNASFTVTRRLAPTIHTLDYYLNLFDTVAVDSSALLAQAAELYERLDQAAELYEQYDLNQFLIIEGEAWV